MFSLNMALLIEILDSHSCTNPIYNASFVILGFRLFQVNKLLRHLWSNVNADSLLDLYLYYFPHYFSYLTHT